MIQSTVERHFMAANVSAAVWSADFLNFCDTNRRDFIGGQRNAKLLQVFRVSIRIAAIRREEKQNRARTEETP